MNEQTREERAYYAMMKRGFGLVAPVYDAMTLPIVRLRRAVVEISGAQPSAKVLDVATGTGAQAYAFAQKCAEVVGLDLSEAMLRVARRKRSAPNLVYVQGDATALPFADATFDVTCVSFGLHEMPVGVRAATVREMARVTKPNGRVVVADYALPRSTLVYRFVNLYEVGGSYADFVHRDLVAFLREAGIDAQLVHTEIAGAVGVWTGVRSAARVVA